jgi:hypothetical protein
MHHPRLIVRSIDPRRTLFSWGSVKHETGDRAEQPSRFVDLHTLAFALTDQNHSLESAGAAFGDSWQKDSIPYGVIDERSLDYAREDVRHTAILYRACLAELRLHTGVDLDAPRLYSPATVGARYLEAMGVDHPLERFMADPELLADRPGVMDGERIHPRLIGFSMGGFFGGRAEARLVRTPVPVTLVDATSMYPTVNANLRTWELLTADRLDVVDVTDDVNVLLLAPDLIDRVLERETWSSAIGVTLVELANPDGDILPVRAFYDPNGLDPGIGLNPLTYGGRLWYLPPDVIAATLLAGRQPAIARALRFVGIARQGRLRSVALRGGQTIDPYTDDPFVRMVEERHRIDHAKDDRSQDERNRLTRFLKITANATAYGILARFDRRELADAVPITVWGPDETPTTKNLRHPEDPGPYAFPPIAATITAAARLMLALLERLVTDAGGTYVFCDTDSMAIVARPASGKAIHCPTPDGTNRINGLGRRTIEGILRRFAHLNPYDPALGIPVWKAEHDSLERPVTCYAISAKRYLLYRSSPDGRTADFVDIGDDPDEGAGLDDSEVLTDWSEHGLGLYLSPLVDERGRPARDDKRRRTWVGDAWRWVLRDALGEAPGQLSWADLPAVTRFTISSPAIESWFRGRDRVLSPEERMRPGGFGLLAQPAEGHAAGPMPAGPYETDPQLWLSQSWYDRRSGRQVRLSTADPVGFPERFATDLASGAVRVRTLGEVLATYGRRPEHKSLAPDGSPAGPTTAGLLRRRPIRSSPVRTHLAGKEGNKLLERLTGVVTVPEDYRTDYGARGDPWTELVVPVLRRMGASEVVQRTNPAWRRSVERIIKDGHQPKERSRAQLLMAIAAAFTREHPDEPALVDDAAALAKYLDSGDLVAPRLCACGCGRPVLSRRAKWFSEACRKRYRRQERCVLWNRDTRDVNG